MLRGSLVKNVVCMCVPLYCMDIWVVSAGAGLWDNASVGTVTRIVRISMKTEVSVGSTAPSAVRARNTFTGQAGAVETIAHRRRPAA